MMNNFQNLNSINKTIISFNIYILIFLYVLCTVLFYVYLSKTIGVIVGIISLFHLLYIFIVTNKIKKEYEKNTECDT